MSLEQVIIRLVLSAFLGSVVGLERERHDKAAGLRTHMLVCVGSALIMMVSAYGFNEVLGREATALDPSRVAAQVVSGIGFLGAGIIIFRRDVVVGLTTAAGIWAISGVGLAVGGGLYVHGIIATALIMMVIAAIRPIERLLRTDSKHPNLILSVNRHTPIFMIEDAVHSSSAAITSIEVSPAEDADEYTVQITLNPQHSCRPFVVADKLKVIEGVRRVKLLN